MERLTKADFKKVEKIVGVDFEDIDLLRQAFVHRSFLNENPGFELENNERLEFLGDAVLELVVTEYLYKNYDKPEGELTNWRASLVNSKMLASVASDLGLEDFLYLSKGEAKSTGRSREYILGNLFEALTGAIYLDQGYEAAREFVETKLLTKLPKILEESLYIDPKSRFQEMAQEKEKVTPTYRLIEEWGPDHAKQFKVGVYLGDELVATGSGYSKQQAQTEAAEAAIQEKGWG